MQQEYSAPGDWEMSILSQMMIKENIEILNGYGVKKIVTACPHCFHSLKNEYKQFGGNYEVLHHSQLIKKLLDSGSIKLKALIRIQRLHSRDSCYLGRYNGEIRFTTRIIEKDSSA